MPGLLHLVVATFRDDASSEAVEAALAHARGLRDAPGVEAVIIARSETQLIVATWLDGDAGLEPFAASMPHMAFVMQGLAPAIREMWSAAVETAVAAPSKAPAELWAFALPERDGVYEWQVRELIDAVEALPGTAAAGVTFEERERFRAAGVVCIEADAEADFAARLADARNGWAEAAGAIEEAQASVVPA